MSSQQRDTVTVERFYTKHASPLGLKLVAGANALQRLIREPTVNRPGLASAGLTQYFAHKRVQVLGNAEPSVLNAISNDERLTSEPRLFESKRPCAGFWRNSDPDKAFLRAAERADVPIFQAPLFTMKFINL